MGAVFGQYRQKTSNFYLLTAVFIMFFSEGGENDSSSNPPPLSSSLQGVLCLLLFLFVFLLFKGLIAGLASFVHGIVWC